MEPQEKIKDNYSTKMDKAMEEQSNNNTPPNDTEPDTWKEQNEPTKKIDGIIIQDDSNTKDRTQRTTMIY